MWDLPKLAWSRDVTGKVDNIHSNLTPFFHLFWVWGDEIELGGLNTVTYVSKGRVPLRSTGSVEQPIKLLSELTY